MKRSSLPYLLVDFIDFRSVAALLDAAAVWHFVELGLLGPRDVVPVFVVGVTATLQLFFKTLLTLLQHA